MRTRIAFAVALVSSVFCLPAWAGSPVVLFDQAHGQRFVIEKSGGLNLSRLAEVFQKAGFEVRSTAEPVTAGALKGVTAFVTSGAFSPFSPAEVEAVVGFVRSGGRAAVLLHIPQPYTRLLEPLGIHASAGVVHETENVNGPKSLEFRVLNLAKHPLFAGITGFDVHGSWALINRDATARTVAHTSRQAWMDMNGNNMRDPSSEPVHIFSIVAVGEPESRRVAAFADDGIFQDQFLTGDNLKLAENLATWFRR